jgi:non-specific serine/threonine protein kinase
VTERGSAKVLDFGLASHATPQDSVAGIEEALTRPGTVIGTVAYMSPEQARGELLDARTDIFSLGAVLYEMVTGRPPFRGSTAALIYDALLNRDPLPAADLNPEVRPPLQQVIAKALRKDRNERYQTAAALRDDLKALAAPTPLPDLAARQCRFVDSIAVLPFENAAADPEMEYLSDGISENHPQ